MVEPLRHRQTKGAETDMLSLTSPRHVSTLPASNPCGEASDYVVNVPGGQERLAVVEAGVFRKSVLVVTQGTADDLPFAVTIE